MGAPQPAIAYYNRGAAEEALGLYADAYHDYQQAETLAPGFTEAAEQLKHFRVEHKPASGT